MSAKREPAFVRLTLEWCNRQRAKKGRKPLVRLPRGIKTDPLSCPCGAATGLEVLSDRAHDPDHGYKVIRIPIAVKDFIGAFDDGKLPQYVKRVKP